MGGVSRRIQCQVGCTPHDGSLHFISSKANVLVVCVCLCVELALRLVRSAASVVLGTTSATNPSPNYDLI